MKTRVNPYFPDWENCPAHSHDAPGIWDNDNGKKAGTLCDLCFRWNEFGKVSKERDELRAELNKLRGEKGE